MSDLLTTQRCEMGGNDGRCPNTATHYGGYAGAGDWAGRVCAEHVLGLAWSEPLNPEATPAQVQRQAELVQLLLDVEDIVRNEGCKVMGSSRSGEKATLTLGNEREQTQAVIALKRAGFTCRGHEWVPRVTVQLIDRAELDRLRLEDARERASNPERPYDSPGPVYRVVEL